MLVGNNFIFVRNPKAASTSINHALRSVGENYHKHHHSYWEVRRPIRFTVVRNPFDRMVSGWNHFTKTQPEYDFYTWLTGEPHRVASGIDFKRTSQYYWCDFCTDILFFESLEEQWLDLCERLNFKGDIPKMNVKAHNHYRDIIDSRSRAIIEDRFAWEIKRFSYSF